MKKFLISNFEFIKRYWPSQKGFIKFTKRTLISYLIISIVFFGTGLIYLFNPFGTRSVDAAWFNDNWNYRKNIPITAHTSEETGEYIAVTIADTDDLVTAGQLQSDCDDMRFTKQNGDLMPYYIVSGCNSASTVVHIYFDTFPAGAQTLYFYYGNPSTIAGGEAADFTTEASNYTVGTIGSEEKGPSPIAYWKFDEGQGQTANDSTTNSQEGTLGSTGGSDSNDPSWRTEDICVVGKCLEYISGDDYVAVPDSSIMRPQYVTVSTWVKFNVANENSRIIDQQDEDFTLNLESDDGATGTKKIRFVINGSHSIETDSGVPLSKWIHVAATYDGSTLKMYIDGKQQAATASFSGTINQSAGDIMIGSNAAGGAALKGFLDEMKIYSFALSADQIKANFNAKGNPEGVSSVLGMNTQNMPGTLSNGLVGYWKMDEASWNNNCSDQIVLDSSGNSNNGTACPNSTGPTGGAAGKYGNGGDFDGSNDYVSVADNNSLDIAAQLTVAAWIKADSADLGNYATIISKRYGESDPYNNWILDTGPTGVIRQFCISSDAGGGPTNGQWCLDGGALTTDWTHVVGTYDGVTQKLFINGQLAASQAVSITLGTSDQPLRIGSSNGSEEYFDGIIDESRVYNRALSPNEVSQLYNWAPGPVGYWKMDEGTANSCGSSNDSCDSSGNGNNGDWQGNTAPTTGKYSKGTTYDGSGDRIDVPHSSTLNAPGDWTVSGWFKSGVDQFSYLVIKGYNENENNPYFVRLNSGNTLETGFRNTFTAYTVGYSSASINSNTWTHFAGQYKASTRELSLYVNGVLVAGPTIQAVSTINNTELLYMGGTHVGSSDSTSSLDDIKVYNYQRTQAQIIEDMNAGHPAPGSPLSSTVATWKLDEGYGTSAQDWSGQANTLTLSTATSSWTNNGKFLKAFSGGGTRWMSRADDADFDIAATDDFSVSMWYRSDSGTDPSTTEYLLAKGPLTEAGYALYANTDGTLCFGIDDDTTWNPNVSTCTATDFYDGNWHHITGVRNTTTDTISIYIDGQQKDSDTDTTSATLANASSLYLADVNGTDNGNEFTGSVDEIKFYRSALTSSQVPIDMNRSQSEVLGALSDSSTAGNDNASTRTAQSNASVYCIPGDSSTCTGPAGEWTFDEGSGTNAQDSSTNGNTGAITAGSGSYLNGKINKAYTFDGSSTLVNAGSGSSLDNLPASGMTAEAWIYPTGAGEGNAGFILAKNNGSSQNAGWLFLTLNTGGPTRALQFVIDGSTDLVKTTSNNVYSYNTWNHVAVTSNSNFSAGSVHIYVNGKEVTYTGSSGGSSRVSDAASSFYIGNSSSGDRTFAGTIDQVRVYNYERTPAQIAWSYNQGKPIAHWKIDECQGTTINDMSGNSETGTLTIGGSGGNTTAGTCTTSGAWFDGVTGKRNYSIDIDGTDDYITMGTATYGLQTGDAPFTIALWAKPSATRFDGCYFSYGGAASGQVISLCAENSNKMYSVHYSNDHAFTTTWTLGSWQHVILSYNPTTSTESLYVNGQLMETWTPSNLDLQSSATSYIGRASWSGTYAGASQIDDVRLYNYSLTANQAKSLYNDGATRYGPVTGAP